MNPRVFILSALLLSLPTTGHAQPAETGTRTPSVTASGEAVISIEPDQAEIDIGVVTQAKNAPDAASENANKLARVMAAVKKLLAQGDEIKTASYSLNPNYRYPREGGRPEITGYTATNILRITTGTLPNVGKLIDAAMASGANTIQRLVYNLKDESGAQRQALRLASQKAKVKAEEIAGALGLKIIKILSVTEVERAVRPIVMAQGRAAQMEAMAAAPTPIEAGTIEVRSTVTLTAEIAPR
jgi:uncharacterized protein YggE